MQRLLLAVGLLATLFALICGYVRSELLDSSSFGDRAVEAVRSEPVRAAIATGFADELIGRQPRLLSARPVLISATSALLGTRAAGGLVSRSAVQLHRALLTEDEPSIILDLADLTVVVQSYLSASGSDLSTRIRVPEGELSLQVATRELSADAIKTGRQVSAAAFITPLVALLCFAALLATAPDRRRALLRIGIGLIGIGALVATAYVLLNGLAIAGAGGGEPSAARAAIADAFLGDILLWAGFIGAAGALLAAAAATLLGPIAAPSLPKAAWAWASTRPATPLRRALRDLGLVAAGILIVSQPTAALAAAASIAGGYIAVVGLVGLLALATGAGSEHQTAGEADLDAVRPRARVAIAAAGLALLAPVIGTLVVSATADRGDAIAAALTPAGTCNGSAALCDRRLDQIVFPTSHNAMGTAADGFLNANHGMSFEDQLDVGIRGLLIDALAGQTNDRGVVRTDLTGKTQETVEAEIGVAGLAAAQRLAGRVAFGPIAGDTDLFLCHVLCELGASPAVPEFRMLHDWLQRNPREVLIIFIQDEAGPQQIVDALRESGLADFAATVDQAKPMPTLRQLISSGKRAVLMAENRTIASAPWYLDGFELSQDTPFAFRRTDELKTDASCDLNRGPAMAPLFLLNHWIESYPPNPVNADVANAVPLLVERAKRCQKIRGRVPNLLAIDFVERGDVVGAAAQLNRDQPWAP